MNPEHYLSSTNSNNNAGEIVFVNESKKWSAHDKHPQTMNIIDSSPHIQSSIIHHQQQPLHNNNLHHQQQQQSWVPPPLHSNNIPNNNNATPVYSEIVNSMPVTMMNSGTALPNNIYQQQQPYGHPPTIPLNHSNIPTNPTHLSAQKVNRKYRQLRKQLKTCKHFEDNYFVLELPNATNQTKSAITKPTKLHPPPYQGQTKYMAEFCVVTNEPSLKDEEVLPLSAINHLDALNPQNQTTKRKRRKKKVSPNSNDISTNNNQVEMQPNDMVMTENNAMITTDDFKMPSKVVNNEVYNNNNNRERISSTTMHVQVPSLQQQGLNNINNIQQTSYSNCMVTRQASLGSNTPTSSSTTNVDNSPLLLSDNENLSRLLSPTLPKVGSNTSLDLNPTLSPMLKLSRSSSSNLDTFIDFRDEELDACLNKSNQQVVTTNNNTAPIAYVETLPRTSSISSIEFMPQDGSWLQDLKGLPSSDSFGSFKSFGSVGSFSNLVDFDTNNKQ
ncbi:hypothetical protein ABK040_010833 [Willaertia magna]